MKAATAKAKLIPKIDVGFEILNGPLPYKDSSVEEVSCIHVLSKVPAKQRGKVLDEIYRVLVKGGKAVILVPYWSSMRAIADFAYEWPPISEMSFLYFNKEWRDNNKAHPELKCNFDFTYGYSSDADVVSRSSDVQAFWVKHYTNTALDLQVTLVKK